MRRITRTGILNSFELPHLGQVPEVSLFFWNNSRREGVIPLRVVALRASGFLPLARPDVIPLRVVVGPVAPPPAGREFVFLTKKELQKCQ